MSDSSNDWIANGDWRQYEVYVLGSLQRRFPGAKTVPNAYLPGLKSGRLRQIDVLIEGDLGGMSFRIAFDCKCYKRKVDIKAVETFLGMLDDIRVSKGVLITTKGYSKAARKRVERETRDIDLQTLSPERLSPHQHVGAPLFWKGPVAASVEPPGGWVTDNENTGAQGWCQFSMYPLGHTLESAKRLSPFIYGNIILKSDVEPTMDAIASRHERNILNAVPDAEFIRLTTTPDEFGYPSEKILFRIGYVNASYNGPEYSIYIDHIRAVLVLVLLCPNAEEEKWVPLLKNVARSTLFFDRAENITSQI